MKTLSSCQVFLMLILNVTSWELCQVTIANVLQWLRGWKEAPHCLHELSRWPWMLAHLNLSSLNMEMKILIYLKTIIKLDVLWKCELKRHVSRGKWFFSHLRQANLIQMWEILIRSWFVCFMVIMVRRKFSLYFCIIFLLKTAHPPKPSPHYLFAILLQIRG